MEVNRHLDNEDEDDTSSDNLPLSGIQEKIRYWSQSQSQAQNYSNSSGAGNSDSWNTLMPQSQQPLEDDTSSEHSDNLPLSAIQEKIRYWSQSQSQTQNHSNSPGAGNSDNWKTLTPQSQQPLQHSDGMTEFDSVLSQIRAKIQRTWASSCIRGFGPLSTPQRIISQCRSPAIIMSSGNSDSQIQSDLHTSNPDPHDVLENNMDYSGSDTHSSPGSSLSNTSAPLLDLKDYFESQQSQVSYSRNLVIDDLNDHVGSKPQECSAGNHNGKATTIAQFFERAFGAVQSGGEHHAEMYESDVESSMASLSIDNDSPVVIHEEQTPESESEQSQFESGLTNELTHSGYDSDTDCSATTVFSPRSSGSWMKSSPVRRLIRKSPKPIAAITPMRHNVTIPVRRCYTRKNRNAKRKPKTKPAEKWSTEGKQVKVVQRVLQDYFKVKKKKTHYKKEAKNLKKKLACHELGVLGFDELGEHEFDPQIFKNNISEKLSKSLKNRFSRKVLSYAKQQAITRNAEISSKIVNRPPAVNECGCLRFNDGSSYRCACAEPQTQTTNDSISVLQVDLDSQQSQASDRFIPFIWRNSN